MDNIKFLGKSCCGCAACEQLCPKGCITLKPDREGFLYPEINEEVCVGCGVCVGHCPVAVSADASGCEKSGIRNPVKKVYAARIHDSGALFCSTSGGVFALLALCVLKKGGVVFGCAFDGNLTARHIRIESADELALLQSSKYVQSDIRGIYSRVKQELESGRYVLFSGTGCQAAGLRTYLGKDYGRLLVADVVCHGVPSPKLFKRYIEWLGGKMGGKITYFNFRSKKGHGWQHFFQADTESKSKVTYGMFDPYYNAFIKSKTIRESCYECAFSNAERAGDITLGDYWGIEFVHPEFYSSRGVSLVLVNTVRGEKLWEEISPDLDCVESELEKAARLNGNLVSKPVRPECRGTVYDGIDGDFDTFVKTKLKFRVNPLKRIIMLIPSDFKAKLKRLRRR